MTQSTREHLARKIMEARDHVGRTMIAHRRGQASVENVNAANDALARAHAHLSDHTGGRVPSDRELNDE